MLLKKFIWPIFLLLVLFLSAGLISYAWWSFKFDKGNQALRRGDMETAGKVFGSAETPFVKIPWAAHILKSDYQKLVFSQVGVLYAQGKDDEAAEKLEEAARRAPSLVESGEYSFWTGNVLLRRAIQGKNPEASMNALKSAMAEYQKGLAAQPDDWDLKYNYELVRNILSNRDKTKEDQKVKSILEKMRPIVEPSREELPPEKRG